MRAGYDYGFSKISAGIYNNFGHGKWICYDKRVQKSWGNI